jgi:hypothetical protein
MVRREGPRLSKSAKRVRRRFTTHSPACAFVETPQRHARDNCFERRIVAQGRAVRGCILKINLAVLFVCSACLAPVDQVTPEFPLTDERIPNSADWQTANVSPGQVSPGQSFFGLFPIESGMWIEQGLPIGELDSVFFVWGTANVLLDKNRVALFPSNANFEVSDIPSVASACGPTSPSDPTGTEFVTFPFMQTVEFADPGKTSPTPIWPMKPLSQALAPGVVRFVDHVNGTFALALNSFEVFFPPQTTCFSVTKFGLITPNGNSLLATEPGTATSLLLTSTQVHRVVLNKMTSATRLQSLNRATNQVTTHWEKTTVKDCQLFSSDPLQTVCVNEDRTKAMLIDSAGKETVIARNDSKAGMRVIYVVSPKDSPVAVLAMTSKVTEGNLNHVLVYKAPWKGAKIVLEDKLIDPIFIGRFAPNSIRVMLSDQTSIPRYADFSLGK